MSAFDRIRDPGEWLTGTTVKPSEFEQLDEIRPKVANFAEGGAYAPTDPIIVGGGGIDVLTPERAEQVTPRSYVDQRVFARGALYQISSGSSSPLGLTQMFASQGIELHDGDTTIQVPSGIYLVSVNALVMVCATTTDPFGFGAYIRRGSTQLARVASTRFSGNALHRISPSGSVPVEVTDPESQRINVSLDANTAVEAATDTHNLLSIVCISGGVAP